MLNSVRRGTAIVWLGTAMVTATAVRSARAQETAKVSASISYGAVDLETIGVWTGATIQFKRVGCDCEKKCPTDKKCSCCVALYHPDSVVDGKASISPKDIEVGLYSVKVIQVAGKVSDLVVAGTGKTTVTITKDTKDVQLKVAE